MKEHTTQSRTAYRSQLKEHKKLYKSGKNWMAATLLTVGLAGGAMLAGNTTANADALPAQSSETAQTVADNSELSQTQQEAKNQQGIINQANIDLQKQQEQLNDLQSKQAETQEQLDQTTSSNPEVKNAQTAVNDAQQKADKTQTTVSQDEQAVQQAKDGVSQAQQEADQSVEHQRDVARQATEQAANNQVSEAQNKIDQLENQGKAQASQELNNQITDAQNKVSDTQSQINDAQSQKQDLQNQQSSSTTDTNIKQVPNGYIDTTKSLLENVSRSNLWNSESMDANNNGNPVEQNIYVTPDNDKGSFNTANKAHGVNTSLSAYDPYYDATHFDSVNTQTGMTDAQKQELAILMMNQINHARMDRGLKPFTMSEQKYNQAQVRASQNSAQSLTHDVNDMISAFGQDQYECLAYIPTNGGSNMMGMLFNADTTLSNMLNADASSDWGHRENFLWDTGDLSYDAAFGMHLTDDGQYYILTFDFDGPAHNNTPNMMDEIANYAAMGPITPSANTVDNSAKINDLNNQISNLQSTLATQQAHLNDLKAKQANVQFDLSQLNSEQQNEHNKAKDDLNIANEIKANIEASLDSNTNVKQAKAEGEQKVNNAKAVQQQVENKLAEAKAAQAQAEQDLATKKAALKEAQAKVNTKASGLQAQLDNFAAQISKVKSDMAATQTKKEQAQAKLDQLNKKIADLQNAGKPSTGDKGGETTNPTTPTKPDEGNKDHGTTPAEPSTPTKGDDNKGSETPTQPSQPAKPDEGNKDHGTTPAEPSAPTKGDDNKGGETPTQPAQPTKPDTGNASISGQAGHQPAKGEDNGSQTTKPTIVLPDSGSSTNTQGQYVNVVSQPSVASQAGIQAPASMETTNVSFGTKTSEPMTREEYKAQQAKLPQTGNKNGKAMEVAGLGILAATTFTTLISASKRKHN